MDDFKLNRRDAAKLTLGAAVMAGVAHAADAAGYRNASLPIAARVSDLLSRMTLEEKVQQLVGVGDGRDKIEDSRGAFDRAAAKSAFPHGFGFLCSPSFNHVVRPGRVEETYGEDNHLVSEMGILQMLLA